MDPADAASSSFMQPRRPVDAHHAVVHIYGLPVLQSIVFDDGHASAIISHQSVDHHQQYISSFHTSICYFKPTRILYYSIQAQWLNLPGLDGKWH